MRAWGRSVYQAAVGMVVGALLVGGLLPFTVNHQGQDVATAPSTPVGGSGASAISPTAQGTDPAAPTDLDGSPAPGATSASSSAGPARPAAAASAEGVPGAEGTIKIGILLLDIAGAASLGFGGFVIPSPEHQREIWQTWVDDRNAAGGVAGRRIDAVYRTFDGARHDTQRADCLALTEDAKVFAVLESTSGFSRDAVGCVTAEHATPMLTAATPVQISHDIARSSGQYLFGLAMSATRSLTNAAVEWHNLGLLNGSRIGILDLDGFTSTIDVGLLPKLREYRYDVRRRVVFSSDQHTAATQVPTAVLQMRQAGVDSVVLATDGLTGTQFVQEAEAQGYHPQYLASDYLQYTQDFNTQNMPAAFDGAIGITAQRIVNLDRLPQKPAEDRCQNRYEQASGTKIMRSKDGDWPFVILSCAVFGYFAAGADNLTGDLTRDSLSAAIQQLGEVDPPAFAPGLFRPGKFDAADHVATMRWHGDCRCWRHQGGYRRAAVT